VSWPVTVTAWVALALDVAVALGVAGQLLALGFLGDISTLGGHGGLVVGVAVLAAVVMGVVGLRTGGFRRANRAWFRVWTAGFVLSALAAAPLAAAAVAGLVIVALCLAAALLVAALFFAMLGAL
jgi:hypothetical protein